MAASDPAGGAGAAGGGAPAGGGGAAETGLDTRGSGDVWSRPSPPVIRLIVTRSFWMSTGYGPRSNRRWWRLQSNMALSIESFPPAVKERLPCATSHHEAGASHPCQTQPPSRSSRARHRPTGTVRTSVETSIGVRCASMTIRNTSASATRLRRSLPLAAVPEPANRPLVSAGARLSAAYCSAVSTTITWGRTPWLVAASPPRRAAAHSCSKASAARCCGVRSSSGVSGRRNALSATRACSAAAPYSRPEKANPPSSVSVPRKDRSRCSRVSFLARASGRSRARRRRRCS